uniref:ST8 alpha-N-acetyl-neuraminide alpha-2,8-sialyltransferase 6 n=1 Tax=Neogobius melanostomus TaxID=47308 RepID=A0A8C6UVP7_9GOBI
MKGITHLQTVEALLSGTMDSVLWRFFFHRSSLITNCNGSQKAFVTQTNSPLKTTIVYDMDKQTYTVTEDLFSNFPKVIGYKLSTFYHYISVITHFSIYNEFVVSHLVFCYHNDVLFLLRCNLPPLGNGYSKDVGKKTDLVTANPSIIKNKFGSLTGRRRAFVDYVSIYGDAFLFLPGFTTSFGTTMSMNALYTLEDFRSSVKAVFMNPDYLRSLDKYWRAQGVKPGSRLSTGFMMLSLALEICNNVDVYGFWPFDNHPYGFQSLTHHYYDNYKPDRNPHAMPAEFAHLIKLHNQGVLKLHVGECPQ